MPDLWPFPPLVDSGETLEWLTNVLTTRLGEQRLKLRADPRLSFEYMFHLNDIDLADARGKITANPAGDWLVPVWHDRSWSGAPVGSADTNIPCETAASYVVGGQVVLWQSPSDYALATIAAINVGSLDLTAPIGTDFADPIVAPIRTAFASGGFSISRLTIDQTRVSVKFRARDLSTSAASDLDQYLGADVQTDPPLATKSLDETIAKPVEYIDNGTGPIAIESRRDIIEALFSISYLDAGAAAYWRRRQWISSLAGKIGTFWLPSWAAELRLAAVVGSSDTSIKVAPVLDDPASYVGLHIIITDTTGRLYREITAAVVNGVDHELTLAPLGRAVLSARIDFMRLCRLDTDSIIFEHSGPDLHRFRAVCREVVE